MFDVAVIGCGVVGAAIAYDLSKYNLNVAVLERENDVAMGTTRANSAILHAGHDPQPGTLMAKLNVRGSELAKKICQDLDVPYIQNGALVLAFDDADKNTIQALYERGKANGVKGLRVISADEVKQMEPQISRDVVCALHAPTSAICNPWEFCLAMAETAVKNGVVLKLNCEVQGINQIKISGPTSSENIAGKGEASAAENSIVNKDNANSVDCGNEGTSVGSEKTCTGVSEQFFYEIRTDTEIIQTRFVINAAGCDTAKIHDMTLPHSFDILPSRGEYYLLDKGEGGRVGTTVFQCPSAKGKGVLVSPTVHGNLIVGPSSEASQDFSTATTAAGLAFVRDRAKKSVPGINFSENIRNFAGVRAKSTAGDFIIEENDGFVDVAGICSPGLSAAPAIAEYVTELLKNAGLKLEAKKNFDNQRRHIRVKELPMEERIKLIEENPAYGEVICRCETITRGEIMDCFEGPIPPVSVDGVKRRAGTGMGRCQGGFCSPLIVEILAKQLGNDMTEMVQDRTGSRVLSGGDTFTGNMLAGKMSARGVTQSFSDSEMSDGEMSTCENSNGQASKNEIYAGEELSSEAIACKINTNNENNSESNNESNSENNNESNNESNSENNNESNNESNSENNNESNINTNKPDAFVGKNTASMSEDTSSIYDLIVIGGGPAGMAAALAAREKGVRKILIVERGEKLGGILNQCVHTGFGLEYFKEELTGPEYAARFIERVSQSDIEVRCSTMVLKIEEDKSAHVSSEVCEDKSAHISSGVCEDKSAHISSAVYGEKRVHMSSAIYGYSAEKTKAVVLAMGCRERARGALAIPGERPAGVLTAGTAQRFVNINGYLPGKKVVILGSGDIGLIMARRMTLEGADVLACVEIKPQSGGLKRNIVQCLDDFGIPLLLSHTVTDIRGKNRVEQVVVAQVDEHMQPIAGTEQIFDCDTLLLSCGLIPENELSRGAGLEMDRKTMGPVINESLETTIPGIFACGNVAHVHDIVDHVTAEAVKAGEAAAKFIAEYNF